MECPHCSKELPAGSCPGCGHLSMPGSSYCHHCGQEVSASPEEGPGLIECQSCGRKHLPGSNFCAHCGKELPAPEGEGPRLLACASCGRAHLPLDHVHCPGCGTELAASGGGDGEAEVFDRTKRRACSDGNCIGIIGPDGKCSDCAKPYTGPAE